MKIALLGYGKMGKEIEKIALERGHEISLRVSSSNKDFSSLDLKDTDVAIEFSRPEFAIENIEKCVNAGVPVVVGTTGWYEHFEKVREKVSLEKGALLYATNFSIGVNIFFAINKKLAQLINPHPEYQVRIDETHHTQKLDAPSGTAITIAEGIISQIERKSSWVLGDGKHSAELNIFSHRKDNIPGTHVVRYSSEIDDIEISHTAHNRKGFALGAVVAAEWLSGKEGIFTMSDVLQINEN